jgi:hypothetical protein
MLGMNVPKLKNMCQAKLMVSNSPTRNFKGDHETRAMQNLQSSLNTIISFYSEILKNESDPF